MSAAAYPVVVDAGKRPPLVDVRDLWRYRSLIGLMASRDVKLRFRQTRLGAAWLFINPLLFTAGYAFLFGGVGGVRVPGDTYFVFTFVGISLWGSFNYVFNRTCNCLLANRELLTHVYFPRLAVPLAGVLTTQLDVVISWALLLVFLVADGQELTLRLLLVPVWFALVQLMAASLGLLVASWTLAFRDLQSITGQVLALGPVFIPVAYPTSALPDAARFLATFNPLTPLFDAMRASTLGGPWPSVGGFAFAGTSALVLGLCAVVVFARAERRLADVI